MATVTSSHPQALPIAPTSYPISSSSPRSSSTSISTEKFGLSTGIKPRKASSKHNDVDRSASPNRWKTFRASFKYLYDLTPKQVDDYMSSYVIYNLDWENQAEMVSTLGPNYQQRVGDSLKAYYGVMNHLCALGDVEKMYIPPLLDRQASVLDNQLLNEEAIAKEIGLRPGDRVLDLGCGRGRVAAHMSSFTGARVTGLNIDPNQIAQARAFNEEQGLQNEFVEHDQNDLPLPFADQSFDAFYEIQALSLCKDPRALFKEIFRVLKPGSKFLLMDWVSLPAYNPENPEHAGLMRRVKPLIGAVGTPTPASFELALKEAGFIVTTSDNPSIDGLQAPLIDKVDIYFRAMRQAILAAVKLHMLPRHFKSLINRLCLDGQAFVEMDNMRLITTTYRIVAEKPKV
ncbi:S-adenosyl-L-methionine-dependent methyltransferase [Phialemonium atrogriseum]|uniref:S-adenosyl-L-methionine-dependent methyltransferase n=1 Tax=Phialemonium atrogriseum TaxID=1093897 RepID=A0AAJ0FF82_9PEZI|nr:S-adenosyl-L-methionine-dependent methyltransferase [Phialemonium atrogriseum]KAK1765177.1 S-adenosyl-L-methionine-dependent methyltransferase [Phialemonium atrogriseum]